jgi:hypothetical protein
VIEGRIRGDARVEFLLKSNLDFALGVQDGFTARRYQFVQEFFTQPTEIRRGFYLELRWRY